MAGWLLKEETHLEGRDHCQIPADGKIPSDSEIQLWPAGVGGEARYSQQRCRKKQGPISRIFLIRPHSLSLVGLIHLSPVGLIHPWLAPKPQNQGGKETESLPSLLPARAVKQVSTVLCDKCC